MEKNNKWDKVLDDLDIESNKFESLLPFVIRVAAKSISDDLIFVSEEEINQVKNKVLTENRDNKIKSILENSNYVEQKLETHPEYKKLIKKALEPMSPPTSTLFYMKY